MIIWLTGNFLDIGLLLDVNFGEGEVGNDQVFKIWVWGNVRHRQTFINNYCF